MHEPIIEEGWLGMDFALPPDATPQQIADARRFFFCGALHLWTQLVELLGDDALSERRKDFKLIDVQKELEAFVEELHKTGAGGRLNG